MSYWKPPWMQRPARPAPKPIHVPASLQMLAEAEFKDRPFGGYAEFAVPDATPPQPPQPVWQPPPPPWVTDPDGFRAELAAQAPPEPPLAPERFVPPPPEWAAHDRDEDGWPIMVGPDPPIAPAPLERPRFPEPDWELEAREAAERERDEQKRIARERRAELLRELLAEDEEAYPAKRRPT